MTEKCKIQERKMYAAESFVLRASIVLGLVAAVMTILYFTPYPDEYFVSCDRPCHEFDWPMICRVQLTIEPHKLSSSSCEDCTKNETNCDPENCPIVNDGKLRSTLSANLQIPGPPIQICVNDILVVDVVNKIPGKGLAIHWRGQPQSEAPFMDGVPMITQCPISSFTTFQYKFRATASGTHIWHAHSGSEVLDGFHGALIVRQAHRIDPHKKLFDLDLKEHVVFISESAIEISTPAGEKYILPKGLLINGKMPSDDEQSLSVFNVQKGKRYRFRVAYSGSVHSCPITLSVDQHLVKVVALDGNSITAYEASSITFTKGERVDFILKAKESTGNYYLRVHSDCNENHIEGFGVIRYEHSKEEDNTQQVTIEVNEVKKEISNERVFDTALCESVIGKVCATDVNSLDKMPLKLKELDVDKKLFLTFDYRTISAPSDSAKEKSVNEMNIKIYRMNNITFTYPSSPLLTQASDVPSDTICNPLKKPKKCIGEDTCECVHVEEIPLGATVELVLVDQSGDEAGNLFHLHGYKFYIVAHRQMTAPLSLEEVRAMDDEGNLFKRNYGNPVLKDTIRVPKYGVVALRFLASNPGYWMLRDENANKWSRGMDIVFRVGGTCDVPNTPSNFPQCGSWVGPDFFLA